MTDREQIYKKLEHIIQRRLNLLNGDVFDLTEETKSFTNEIIDSLQEEPVSVWHDASEETPTQGSNILMVRKEEKDTNYPPIAGCFHGTNSRLDGRNWGYYNGFCYNEIELPVKWAYIDDILNLSNVERIKKNWKEPVSERFAFKAIPRLLDMIEPTDRAKVYIAKLADTLDVEGYSTDAKIVRESLKIMNGEKVPMATMDEEPVSEPNEQLAETYLAVFDKKFPILPTLKGKQLADYKNFLNKCQQIFGLKEWGIRPTQAKLFEKLSLLWAAWGVEHLQGVGRQDKKEQDISVSEDLEKAIDTYLATYFGGEKEKQDWPFLKKMAIHFANWQKEQMMKNSTEVTVHIDAGTYPYIPQMELYDYDKDVPLAREGDKYKVVLIKEG